MRVLDERGLCTEEKGRGKVSSGIFDTSLSPSHFPGAGRAEPRVQERGSNVLDVAFRGPPLGAAAHACQAMAVKITPLVRRAIT